MNRLAGVRLGGDRRKPVSVFVLTRRFPNHGWVWL